MADDKATEPYELGTSDFFRRQMEIGGLMGKGALYGAAIFISIGVFFWLLILLSRALPPESKEAADPTPWSAMAPADPTDLRNA